MACGIMVALSCDFSITSSKSFPLTAATTTRQNSLLGQGKLPFPHGNNSNLRLFERRRCSFPMPRMASKANKADGRSKEAAQSMDDEEGRENNALLQALLWGMEAIYVLWLFLLPYAPGDPVWAISTATVNDLIGLSLNFLFILPLLNAVGVHPIEAPILHPAKEGLFNLVIGWTLLFAPLLFTDRKRGRFKGSLELLWGSQMFLTNTFLIPYMAIRLRKSTAEDDLARRKSTAASVLARGANGIAIAGGAACILSVFWFFLGREGGGYGGLSDRWDYLQSYIGSERAAYAFIWDIVLYSIFQPWLIGDNLQNLKGNSVRVVSSLKFVPVIGLVAYLLNLDDANDL